MQALIMAQYINSFFVFGYIIKVRKPDSGRNDKEVGTIYIK